MFPWEHAAVAYLCYSVYARLRTGEPPDGWAVLALLFASQLPDLIDKPLAWQVDLLPSGRSLAHSLFVGIPLSAGAVALARRRGTPTRGAGFTTGYLVHLATDAVPLSPGSAISFESVLWPLVTYHPPSRHEGDFLGITAELLTGDAPSSLLADPSVNVLVAIPILVWIADGLPGLRETVVLLRVPIGKMRTALSR